MEEFLYLGIEKYSNIIIDEAHRFRTETTISYENIAEICRGKRVILVTATPYNNSPKDVLSQIKLFQSGRKSTIPNLPDIECFINHLDSRLRGLDRQKDYEKYIQIVKENAKMIREKILKYLMVRRTRAEIEKYFAQDLKQQNIRFPEAQKPEPFFYKLNDKENKVFDDTVEMLTQQLKYARYTPFLYYKNKEKITQPTEISQKNMGKLMKILLVKRLESSFYAFRNTLDRFIYSYDLFIEEFNNGNVYISKKHINKIFELLEEGDDEAVQKLIDEGKAEKYDTKEFREDFITDLKNDLKILKKIKSLWEEIDRDPKLLKLFEGLSENSILKKHKLIIFTESKETAEYLANEINKKFTEIALLFTGSSGEYIRDKVIENFDARARTQRDDYRILISTEVLSEGVNLHRSNTVINYDIPWNPTRMMQRVGRINRVDTPFDKIYTFNFFPTKQSNDELRLRESAIAKIHAFLTLLGGDAALLTEGEPVGSHELFNKLLSKQTVTGEDEVEESELKYLQVIKEIRDNNSELFNRIKHLPKKARSSKKDGEYVNHLLTYFRRGKLDKFFIVNSNSKPQEVDFLTAVKVMECDPNTEKQKLTNKIYELLEKNKQAFLEATTEEANLIVGSGKGGKDSARKILGILKATLKNSQQLTDEQETYIRKVFNKLEEGALPKQTTKETLKALEKLGNEITNPLKVITVLQTKIPTKFLEEHYAKASLEGTGKREVILSMYFSE